jgi:hypothetical protein
VIKDRRYPFQITATRTWDLVYQPRVSLLWGHLKTGKFGIGRAKKCLFKKFYRMILVFRGEYIVENATKSSAVGEKMSS